MKLHDLQPDLGSKKKRKRVGRGQAAGQGGYAGRGIKGQGSRGGKPKGAYFEGGQLPLVRRLPFKRGFNNIFRIPYQEVRLDRLARVVELANVDRVDPDLLAQLGLIRDAKQPVVVLGNGEISRKVTVQAHRFTKSAEEKIKAAGGSTEIIPLTVKGVFATVRKMRKEDLEKLTSGE
jgi:large subunit ribosomal protein L15